MAQQLPDDSAYFDLTGKVITPAGDPASGATVYHYRHAPGKSSESRVLGEITTGPDGTFVFESVARRSVDEARDHVVAFSPGFGLAHSAAHWADRGAQPVLLKLPEEAVVEGTVRDENGAPAVGARVVAGLSYVCQECRSGFRADRHYLLTSEHAPLPEAVTTTDSQGRFRIGHLPRGDHGCAIFAWGDQPATRQVTVPLRDQVNRTELRFRPCGSTEGKVVLEATGEPLAGLTITASLRGLTICREVRTVTDENGLYHFSDLTAGTHCIRVEDPGDTMCSVPLEQGVEVRPSETTDDADFVMSPSGILRGRAVAVDTGEPLAGVGVQVWGYESWWTQPETASDGTFSCRVPAGTNHLQCQTVRVPRGCIADRDFLPDVVGFRWSSGQTVTVPPDGESEVVRLEVKKGVTLAGEVVDARGRPVPGCHVLPRRENDESVTDEQGRFRLFGIPHNTTFTIVLMDDEGKRGRSLDLRIRDQPDQDVRVKLAPLGIIAGTTVGSEGRPMSRVKTRLLGFMGPSGTLVASTSTDDRGRYEFEVPPGAKCYVYVPVSDTLLGPVKARAGRRHLMKDLSGEPASRKTKISGRVVGSDDQPLPNAEVTMEFAQTYSKSPARAPGKQRRIRLEGGVSRKEASTTADERGEFRFSEEPVIGQPFTITGRDSEGTLIGSTTLTPDQPQTEAIVSVVEAAVVTGRAVDELQQPMSGAQVRVLRDKDWQPVAETTTGQDGEYRITGLMPGETVYVCAQMRGRWPDRSETRCLPAGATWEVADLALLRADSFIAGTVTWRDGRPLESIRVGCASLNAPVVHGRGAPTAFTDIDGRYRLPSVPANTDLKVAVFPQRTDCCWCISKVARSGSTDVDFVVKPSPLWRRLLWLLRRRRRRRSQETPSARL